MTGNTPQGTGQIDRAGLINMEEREIQNRKMETMRGTEKKDEGVINKRWNAECQYKTPHHYFFQRKR